MKTALAGVLAVALAGVLAGSAMAQVPNVQVYFDPNWTQTQTACQSGAAPVELYVVMNNWLFNVAGVDFSIEYPPQLTWLADNLPDPLTMALVGNSPTGIAVAWGGCCIPDGTLGPILALKPSVLWGPAPCDCALGQVYPVIVRGYTPLGKTQPSAVSSPDFTEISGVGMTSLICGATPVESKTWGGIKALYR